VRSWKSLKTGAPSDPVTVHQDAIEIGNENLSPEEGAAGDSDLISSLPADESRLYQMIVDSGGEALQMHIVSSGAFSKAKVTRLLDKLEKKGVVVRERHGMTNRIRILR
jgi:uncharacterized membrane protein